MMIKYALFLLLIFHGFFTHAQKESILHFNFICDHSQTTIIADQSIIIYIMSLDKEKIIKSTSYCSRKEVKIPSGTYSIIVESSKYCTHEIEEFELSEDKQELEINLLKESDPDCKNEQNFEPHPTRFD
ncbi:MAG: hypothetical protein WED10_00370 [Brumimicrobium sp.]